MSDADHKKSAAASDTGEHLALRVHMMPKDANHLGTVFGGTILSLIDQAGFHEAIKHGRHRYVTASIDAVNFLAPVYIGDGLSLYSRVLSFGRTSIRIAVRVVSKRTSTGEEVEVTGATMTMVAVDPSGTAIPWNSPPTAGMDAHR